MAQNFSLPIQAVWLDEGNQRVIGKPINLQRLCVEFLRTAPREAHSFLAEFGERSWDYTKAEYRASGYPATEPTEEEFGQWQLIINRLLRDKCKDVDGSLKKLQPYANAQQMSCLETHLLEHGFSFRRDRWSPQVRVGVLFILEALLLGVLVEKGTRKWQKCARRRCEKSFPSRPGKFYCSQACAHLVSVQKGRLDDRRERAKLAADELRKLATPVPRLWYHDDELTQKLALRLARTPRSITDRRNRTEINKAQRRFSSGRDSFDPETP